MAEPNTENEEEINWYYSDNYRNKKGPVKHKQFIELIKQGEIQKLSLCWKKGMKGWEELKKIEELKELLISAEDKTKIEQDIKEIEKLAGSDNSTKIKKRKRAKKKMKWKNFRENANVYITGLPSNTKETDLATYFSKCGIIKKDPLTEKFKVKLYKDGDGNLKGDGLVAYLKEESVQLAIDMLDESFYTPNHKIKVQKAEFRMKGDVFVPKKSAFDDNVVKRITKRKIMIAKNQKKELCWDEEQETKLSAKVGLRIVILKPMFDLTEAESSEDPEAFYNELGKEVGLECERVSGPIEKLTVFKGSKSGAIAIKFKNAVSAAKCIGAMNGRFFGGKQIEIDYFDGTDYRAGVNETEEERNKRIEEFNEWLEKGN